MEAANETRSQKSEAALPLPEDVVTLASPEGQRRLEECSAAGEASPSQYATIGPCFRTQVGSKMCGAASTAMILSSLPGSERVEEAGVFDLYEDGGQPGAPRREGVEAAGVVLDELHKMTSSVPQLRPAACRYAEDMGGGAEELRATVCEALRQSGVRVLLNYHMSTLGQTPFQGHVSPVAAYHRPTDSFLIMDTWPKTEPVWATAARIWEAARHVDQKSKRSRGIVITGVR